MEVDVDAAPGEQEGGTGGEAPLPAELATHWVLDSDSHDLTPECPLARFPGGVRGDASPMCVKIF